MSNKSKIKRDTIPDQIFSELMSKIISAEWGPGTKIPSETEIGNMFGVSRLSARTAIQRLAAYGLVDVKVGDGTYVKESPLKAYLDNGSDLLLSVHDLDDFAEFRVCFDNAYIPIACKNRTDDDINNLKRILNRMIDDSMCGDLESFQLHDYQFHQMVCRCSHNEFFIMIYRLIGKLYNEHLVSSTESFSTLPGMSNVVESDDYYLKKLCDVHHTYITALETRDASIVSTPVADYQANYKKRRHMKSEN